MADRWNYDYGAGKSISYDAEGVANRLLGVWLCGLISRNHKLCAWICECIQLIMV